MLSKANRYTIIIMGVHRQTSLSSCDAHVFRILSHYLHVLRARIFICLRLFNLFLSDMQISADAFQMEQGNRKEFS